MQNPQIYFSGNGTDRAYDVVLYPNQNYVSRSGSFQVKIIILNFVIAPLGIELGEIVNFLNA